MINSLDAKLRHAIKTSISMAIVALVATSMLVACDETTGELGTSLTTNLNNLSFKTDTFLVKSSTIKVDSVFARSTNGYIGRVIDPETSTYVDAAFTTQFHTLENYQFPDSDVIASKLSDGTIFADSCELRLYYKDTFGDSLAVMKLTAMEMAQPMSEDTIYYSDYNPENDGSLIRLDGIRKDKTYSLAYNTDTQNPNIRIPLNDSYTSKDGAVYNNYGSYIMDCYYKHPEYFKNSYQFIQNVAPGFYFKHKTGLGAIAEVYLTQLNVYFRYHEPDSIYDGLASFVGTEEVLQTTTINNDEVALDSLKNDSSCTYLKTPAGLFTELTLPVDEIFYQHELDSISQAKVVLSKMNNLSTSDFSMKTPQYLLMIPSDSLYTFFEKGQINNNRTSFLAAYSNVMNTYTFNNISGLLHYMNSHRESSNWNKVTIIPVTTSTSSTTGAILNVTHEMEMTSCKLVKGFSKEEWDEANRKGVTLSTHSPLTISVIYSRFE